MGWEAGAEGEEILKMKKKAYTASKVYLFQIEKCNDKK
jgi:hypothetical protein